MRVVDTLELMRSWGRLKCFLFCCVPIPKENRPHVTDWSIIARIKRIGLERGKNFEGGKVSADILTRGAAAGLKLMHDKLPTLARVTNGWQMNTDTVGVYGNYYLKRAIVAMAAPCQSARQCNLSNQHRGRRWPASFIKRTTSVQIAL